MAFQHTWNLNLSGAGTSLPAHTTQVYASVLGPAYLTKISPYYYIPNVDITTVTPFDGHYDYTVSGILTPVGVSLYLSGVNEVTWSIGITASSAGPISVITDKYGFLFSAYHAGSGTQFFPFTPLHLGYEDIWVIQGVTNPVLTFRCANQYCLTISGIAGYPFIPMAASGYNLTNIPTYDTRSPTDWSQYLDVDFVSARTPTVADTAGRLLLTLHIAPNTITVPHSSTVLATWSQTLPSVSGAAACGTSVVTPSGNYAMQTKTIGNALGVNPDEIKQGLLAWHSFADEGPLYNDDSGNGIIATASGEINAILGKYDYAVSLGRFPYGHIEVDGLDQQSTYMCSFWFKPTKLLTPNNTDYFTIFEANSFYGDHFQNSWDYNVNPKFKGWTKLNSFITCQAGYQGDYLLFQGEPNTQWFGSTWNASTIYFPIDESWDWTVRVALQPLVPLSYGQTTGFLFYDAKSYLNYCSLVLQADTLSTSQVVDSSMPYMISSSAPSPYVVSQSSVYASDVTDFGAWRLFADPSVIHSGYISGGNVPQTITIDMGANTYQVIEMYSLQCGGGNFPSSWVLQGSNDSLYWTELHAMFGQPAISPSSWTATFECINPTNYRYYQLLITNTINGNTNCQLNRIAFTVRRIVPTTQSSIKVQAGHYSYVEHPNVPLSGTWFFEMKKRNNTIGFSYRHADEPAWEAAEHVIDISNWGPTLALGLQSSSATGAAPTMLCDFWEFRRGQKPVGWGDAENTGCVSVTYNSLDSGTDVEETTALTAGRIWLNVGHSFSYGTSNAYWDPSQWYLLQFGLTPSADPTQPNVDFCWWVNATQDHGLVVGSVTGPTVIIPSGQPFCYYDPDPYVTQSGAFELDELSHWNRWLTGEEILKMWNKVSQLAWLSTERLNSVTEKPLTALIAPSGNSTLATSPIQVNFNWSTQYIQPTTFPARNVQCQAVSYAIQRSWDLVTSRVSPALVNIMRQSSGWTLKKDGYVPYVPATIPNGPLIPNIHYPFNVKGDAALYTLPFMGLPTSADMIITVQNFLNTTSFELLSALYSLNYWLIEVDLTGPTEGPSQPTANERGVHPMFADYTPAQMHTSVQDFLYGLSKLDTRIWIKRQAEGYNPYLFLDEFNFYEYDFTQSMSAPEPTASGVVIDTQFNTWSSSNIANATVCHINQGFATGVELDLATTASGLTQTVITTGLDSGLTSLRLMAQHYSPHMDVYGTNYLELSTTSGIWQTRPGEQSAPFVFWTIPSDFQPWEVRTKVRVDRFGDERGLSAGLMVCDLHHRDYAFQLLATISGVVCTSPFAANEYAPAASGLITPDSEVWLSISGTSSNLYFNWSNDGYTWNPIYPYADYYIATRPVVSGTLDTTQWDNTMTSGYPCRSNYYTTGYEPWKAFTNVQQNQDDCWMTDCNASGNLDINSLPWLEVDLGSPQTILKYRIKSRPYTTGGGIADSFFRYFPAQFNLLGSNNTTTWVYVDTRSYVWVDPGPNTFSPMFTVQTPQSFRYYRLQVIGTWNDSYSSNIEPGPACISKLELYALRSIQPNLSGVTLGVGPLVIAQHLSILDQSTYSAANIIPYMSNPTTPSGYLITGTSFYSPTTWWEVFAGQTSDGISLLFGDWVDLQFTTSAAFSIVTGYRLNTPAGGGWTSWYLQGSYDGWSYETIDFIIGYPDPVGSSPRWSDWFDCNSSNIPYTHYRFKPLATSTLHGSIFSIEMRGYKQINWVTTSGQIQTTGYFDFVSIYSLATSGVKFLYNQNKIDMWEPLVVGETPLNSLENSGVILYQSVGDTQQNIQYQTNNAFASHEAIYVRKTYASNPSEVITYSLDSNSLLFLDAEDPLGTPVRASIEAQSSSGYYEYDKSPYHQAVTSDPDVYINNAVAYLGTGSFRFENNNRLIVTSLSGNILSNSWIFNCMLHADDITQPSPLFKIASSTGAVSLACYLRASDIMVANAIGQTFYLTSLTRVSGWEYIQINKEDNMLKANYNGHKLYSTLDFAVPVYYPTQGCYACSGVVYPFIGSTVNNPPATNLFDNDASTCYTSSPPWYITYDLMTAVSGTGDICKLQGFTFRAGSSATGQLSRYPRNISISYSNKSNPALTNDADWTNTIYVQAAPATQQFTCGPPVVLPATSGNINYRWIRLIILDSQVGTGWGGTSDATGFYPNFGPVPTNLGTQLVSTSGSELIIGEGFKGYMDMIQLRLPYTPDPLRWQTITQDTVTTFNIIAYTDLSVSLGILPDTEPPQVVPVSPMPNQMNVCPASGIIFDVLDDYSGVNWDHLSVIIDGVTVFSGGNNMTEVISDRGTLTWADRGHLDGEWEPESQQGLGVVYNEGINRQLYPPSTVYSGSGAWGRRFTYATPPPTQMEDFGRSIQVTVTGTDNRGYFHPADGIKPNPFQYEYSFTFIPNSNIQMGNFFLGEGEAERIDILKAEGKYLWVDMWDINYPATDIVEGESYIAFSDSVINFVCSGTWFTTYTGTTGTASGILVHRLHYDAGNYDWDGHRTMQWRAHAQNNDSRCHVYNEDTYELLYGWHIFWLHGENIRPFEFNKQLPVFISIKTQEYVPSPFSSSYMVWTAPARAAGLEVGVNALPVGTGNDFAVDLVAQSQYLQYSEDVEVTIFCQDMDGNELLYTWTFRTEDAPVN